LEQFCNTFWNLAAEINPSNISVSLANLTGVPRDGICHFNLLDGIEGIQMWNTYFQLNFVVLG
jgi:hypothetical protein